MSNLFETNMINSESLGYIMAKLSQKSPLLLMKVTNLIKQMQYC